MIKKVITILIGMTILVSTNANAWFFFWIPIPSGGRSSSTSPEVPTSNLPNGGQSQLNNFKPAENSLLANSQAESKTVNPPIVDISKLAELGIVFQPNANEYYPKISQNEKEEGDVVTKLIINEDGLVHGVYLVKESQYFRLNNSAMEISKAYKFKPYLVDGKAVKISTNLLTKFRISDDDEKSTTKPSKISNDASVRLKKLKELLDNKLITQQDYNIKKTEILRSM
jgi:TonB family protein